MKEAVSCGGGLVLCLCVFFGFFFFFLPDAPPRGVKSFKKGRGELILSVARTQRAQRFGPRLARLNFCWKGGPARGQKDHLKLLKGS